MWSIHVKIQGISLKQVCHYEVHISLSGVCQLWKHFVCGGGGGGGFKWSIGQIALCKDFHGVYTFHGATRGRGRGQMVYTFQEVKSFQYGVYRS